MYVPPWSLQPCVSDGLPHRREAIVRSELVSTTGAVLANIYPQSTHVIDGLDREDDRFVWDFAKSQGLTIVSKDSDFRQLSFMYGPPPKTIWLRVGNASTSVAEALLRASADVIELFTNDPDSALLILPWKD